MRSGKLLALSSSIPQPLINLSRVNCIVWLRQSAHHRLDIPIFQISFCLLLLHVCPKRIPKAWFDPKVSHSIYLALLSLLLCLCLPLAVQTWRTHCTARYYPDVTTNPSSIHDTATTKTSLGQAQRQHNVCLLMEQIQVVKAVICLSLYIIHKSNSIRQ